MPMAHDPHPSESPAPDAAAPVSRRAALWITSRLALVAGLVGGYGMLAWVSGRFMLPAQAGRLHQLFVARIDDLGAGDTVLYRTPEGRTVNITRRGVSGSAADFAALSSTCPHLGCQVHWEAQNNRYFCPCHNGTFNPEGVATGGPPGDAGQSLPRYMLTVEKGLLYIYVPAEQLSMGDVAGVVETSGPIGPGHDPCLTRVQPQARTARTSIRPETRDPSPGSLSRETRAPSPGSSRRPA
jgi:nitrite reductase/ring-hydroxylating ferredoxin subunit